jgi:hypothetical protein
VSAKFDAVAAGELSATFYGSEPELVVKAAFVSKKTGKTHGWTTANHWSSAVRTKLAELRSAIDAELQALHFDAASAEEQLPLGLGEHLSDDVPSLAPSAEASSAIR